MTEAFSPTLASADFAAALQYDAIPTPVVDRIKRDLLDWIGCSIAGSIDPASKPIRAIDALMGGPKQAGVFGAPKMTDMRSAAMMNAYYSHIMEMDDVDRASISHPASCIFPAVLALAGETAKSASGKEMLASVVAGFEVMLRIGAAVTPAHYKVFHTTATTGVFGGAAASARLLGLNAERTAWAIGNAGTSSCGLWQFNRDGAMSKFIHTGYAASNGLFVALLAREGFSGPIHVLEGEQGFFVGYARQDVNFDLFRDFGKFWRAGEISFKPYPCCRWIHPALDALRGLMAEHAFRPEEVASLDVATTPPVAARFGRVRARTFLDMEFSTPLTLALALHGVPRERWFERRFWDDSSVRACAAGITLSPDEGLWKRFLELGRDSSCVPARLALRLRDGRSFEAECDRASGSFEKPLSPEEREEKWAGLLAPLGRERAARLVETALHFDELENIRELTELFGVA